MGAIFYDDQNSFFSIHTNACAQKSRKRTCTGFGPVTPLIERIRNNIKFSSFKNACNQAKCIPRLELLSAVLRLRLAFQLSMDVLAFWGDSMNVLWWIQWRDWKFKSLLANRVTEIQSITNPMTGKHVPTKRNPADLVSRGTTVNVLTSNVLWLNGHSFLLKPIDEWPQMKLESFGEEKIEFKKKRLKSSQAATHAITAEKK